MDTYSPTEIRRAVLAVASAVILTAAALLVTAMLSKPAKAQGFVVGYVLGSMNSDGGGSVAQGSSFPCAALPTFEQYYACRLPSMWNELHGAGADTDRYCSSIRREEAVTRMCDVKTRAHDEWAVIEAAKAKR